MLIVSCRSTLASGNAFLRLPRVTSISPVISLPSRVVVLVRDLGLSNCMPASASTAEWDRQTRPEDRRKPATPAGTRRERGIGCRPTDSRRPAQWRCLRQARLAGRAEEATGASPASGSAAAGNVAGGGSGWAWASAAARRWPPLKLSARPRTTRRTSLVSSISS